MKGRFKFKKISSGDFAHCSFCGAETHFCLFDEKDGSESWCCVKCAIKVTKLKKLSKYLGKKRTTKILINPRVKKSKTGILESNSLVRICVQRCLGWNVHIALIILEDLILICVGVSLSIFVWIVVNF